MAVYGMKLDPDDDGPLRPSERLWQDVARMHNSPSADTERSIFEYAMADEKDGYNSAHRMPLHRSHLPDTPSQRSDEEAIFRAAFPRFSDED